MVPERRIAAKPRFPPTESEAQGVYAAMEMWTEVRRRVLTGELSKRAACQEYDINWRTLGKMLAHAEPPGYRRRVSAIEVRSVLPSWMFAPSVNPFHEGRPSFKTRFTRATKAGRWCWEKISEWRHSR